MKIKISYMTINIIFQEMEGEYGYFMGETDGSYTIYIHKRLSGPHLVDTLFHELSHYAYHIHRPTDEEGTVSTVSTVLTEALDRNKNLRQLVMENLE